jgi:tRNA pseudouridine55 synthase
VDGLLLIDKPVGISSFDIIRSLRRTLRTRSSAGANTPDFPKLKIGHTGTLDPAASGLMLMLFGSACKKAEQYSKLDKIYMAEMTLGANSSTGDREGELTSISDRVPTLEEIEAVCAEFVGEITQTPSIYSAIKINGQEAYKLARKGQAPDMPSRQVTVHSMKVLSYDYPKVTIEADVSSGTYIRTLAEDIGAKLGTGAYLTALQRTRVGDYSVEQAIGLDATSDEISAHILTI